MDTRSSVVDCVTSYFLSRRSRSMRVHHSRVSYIATASNITHILDELPVGWFHALHLAHATFAWCAFSMCQELTPFVLDGLKHDMAVDAARSGLFAAAFAAGCTGGAVRCTARCMRCGLGGATRSAFGALL